jgi:hypothetical protein
MRRLLAISIAVSVAAASIVPAIAADKAPTTKSECEKAHMKWDAASKTCSKGGY